MYDLLAALNSALIPMSAIFFWYFIDYQWKSRNNHKDTPIAIFGWSLFCMSVGMFFSALLYFLWDFDLIYKSTQYKLSVIPRSFFVVGLALGFRALETRWHKTICIIAACLAIGVFMVRVVW